MADSVEMTGAAARFTTWLGEVARSDIDYKWLDYELGSVLDGFLTAQEGAIFKLDPAAARSGLPETFALKREDVVVKRGNE